MKGLNVPLSLPFLYLLSLGQKQENLKLPLLKPMEQCTKQHEPGEKQLGSPSQ